MVKFLKDQVCRLTAVVQEYQSRYTPIAVKDVEAAPLAPWMSDTMVSPLLMEYENNIKSLKEQIGYYKEQFNNLQEKSSQIVEENKKLHLELRRTVESQLVNQESDDLSKETIDQLQNKLKVLSDEKTRIETLYRDALRNTNTSQTDLNSKLQIINTLTAENDQLHDDLKQARGYAENLQKVNQICA